MLLRTTVAAAAIVTIARVLIPPNPPESHRFTAWMLMGTAASALLIPFIAARTDATGWIGANTSWLLQHLLTILGFHAGIRSAHLQRWTGRRWWWWRGYTVSTLITLMITYMSSTGYRTRVPDFGVHHPPMIIHDLVWVTYIAASVAVMLSTVTRAVRMRGMDLRAFAALLTLYAVLVLGADATTAALLITCPDWLARNFYHLEVDIDMPVLLCMSAAGVFGIVATVREKRRAKTASVRP